VEWKGEKDFLLPYPQIGGRKGVLQDGTEQMHSIKFHCNASCLKNPNNRT